MNHDGVTGRPLLRIAGPDNAAALMKLKQRLDQETSFMLLEPGERDTSTQALAGHLEDVSRSENSVVIAHNHRAIALYERVGFVREGRRADCLLIDGAFLDELYMAMLLPGSLSP